jgi:cytochrome b6
MRFVPDFLMRDMVGWLVAVAVLAGLAAFWPWELGVKADPFAPAPAGIRPEWYFLAMFHTLKLVPSHVLGFEGEHLGVVAFGLVAVFLVLVPFLDRRASRGERSPVFTVLAALGLVYLVVFTIIGHYAK